jgi:SAM-dependent methyltransferase
MEMELPSRSLARAAFIGGLVGLAALSLLFLVVWRAPYAQPQNDFNPAEFVRSQPRLDAPNVSTDMQVVDAMLGLAEVRPDDYVIDLGSGDGRILIAAARSNGARGFGVDIDPAMIRVSNDNARAAGVAGKVSFRQQDLFRTPLAEADVLTLYLTAEVNARLRPRILAEMRPGARVVSHDYDMGDWRWDERRRVGESSVFLWTVPARVGGSWTLTVDGESVPLALTQNYQQVSGTAGTARVEQGRLSGADIRFITSAGGRRRTFEGRVDGNRITAVNPDDDWLAVRTGG